jgi:hypothetical protein
MLEGKLALIAGVANKRSIAWGIAEELHRQGAKLAFTYQGERVEKNVRELAATVGSDLCVEMDARDDASIKAAFDASVGGLGGLDLLVHSIAFAQAADRAGTRKPRAVGVTVDSPLARRGAQAFRDAWLALGGEMRELVEFTGPRPSRDLRARLAQPAPDVAFLSMGAEQARVLRGALGAETAVWGTSLASIGNGSTLRLPELDGLRVLEMPWLIEPDNPAVMAYAKVPAGYNVEMQRLYALGIDAFRVGVLGDPDRCFKRFP